MQVTLPPELEEWVRRKVEAGAFASAAEAVAEGLRALREREIREAMKARLERYILEGEDPGPPEGVSAEEWEAARRAFDDRLDRLLEEGIDSLDRGEGVPADEAFARLRARVREREAERKAG